MYVTNNSVGFHFRLKDQLANNPAEIDLQRMTSESRFCRMEMVQTAEQYKFLHVVAVYMIKKYEVKGRGAGKSEAPSQGGDGGKEKGKASDARGSSAVEEQEDGDKEPKGSEAEEKGFKIMHSQYYFFGYSP